MKINLHVFIFVLIALITSINDIFIYSLKIKYSIGLILSVIILVIVSILLIKKNKIKIINPFFAFLREKVLTNPLKYCKVY